MFEPSCIGFRFPCDPPRHQSDNTTCAYQTHRTCERHSVPGRILRPEDLRTHSTTDLAIAVDKANAECRTSCAARCLHTPRPHQWEESRCAGVADQRSGVYSAIGRIDYQHGVTSHDDHEHGQRVDRSRKLPSICPPARETDDDQRQNRYGQVEELCSRNGCKTKIDNDSWLVEAHTGSADSESRPDEREEPQPAILEGLNDLTPAEVLLGCAWCIGRKTCLNERLLTVGEPFGCRRDCFMLTCEPGEWFEELTIGQNEVDSYAEHNCEQPFDQKQPLPSR